MTKFEKIKEIMVPYLEKRFNKIKNAKKISQIATIICDIDGDLQEKFNQEMDKVLNGKYYATDKEFDKAFEEEISNK